MSLMSLMSLTSLMSFKSPFDLSETSVREDLHDFDGLFFCFQYLPCVCQDTFHSFHPTCDNLTVHFCHQLLCGSFLHHNRVPNSFLNHFFDLQISHSHICEFHIHDLPLLALGYSHDPSLFLDHIHGCPCPFLDHIHGCPCPF